MGSMITYGQWTLQHHRIHLFIKTGDIYSLLHCYRLIKRYSHKGPWFLMSKHQSTKTNRRERERDTDLNHPWLQTARKRERDSEWKRTQKERKAENEREGDRLILPLANNGHTHTHTHTQHTGWQIVQTEQKHNRKQNYLWPITKPN